MTISENKTDTSKLVYQINGGEVIFYTVSLNEEELLRIITEVTNNYGKIKMRPEFDEHYEEGAEVKAAMRKDIIGDPMAAERFSIEEAFEEEYQIFRNSPSRTTVLSLIRKLVAKVLKKVYEEHTPEEELKRKYDKKIETLVRKYIGKQADVNLAFQEFYNKHIDDLVELVVTETMAKKEITYPTGSEVLLKDGITCDYVRTELEPMEIISNTVDPKKQVVSKMELANTEYKIIEYPLLAKTLKCVLADLSCIGELDLIIKGSSYRGAEYIDSVLSAINLEPCYTVGFEEFADTITKDPSIARFLNGKRISSNSDLYERFPHPEYYEAYKKYSEGRVKEMN